ncbi:MAG: hypothetical protein JWO51_3979 [Rhodospirillales bacterium]|nr:hypothetical protein [Rhodospirillales bacterium]
MPESMGASLSPVKPPVLHGIRMVLWNGRFRLSDQDAMSQDPPKPVQTLIEAPDAPEIFADGVCGFFLHNQNLRIAFEAVRVDHAISPGPLARTIVARVVLPAAGARGLAVGLFDFLKKMGLEPGNVVPSVTVQPATREPTAEAPKPPTAEPAPSGPTVVDAPGAPDLFADGATGFFLHNGILRIAFEVSRFDHAYANAPAIRVVIGRVAMPAAGASALAVNLFDFLKQMGIDPASVSTVPTVQ